MTLLEFMLIASLITTLFACWRLARYSTQIQAEKWEWRDKYFEARKEAQEEFDMNLELRSINRELLNKRKLPDHYSGELNTVRIKTYTVLSEDYRADVSTVREIFCKGADWYKSLLHDNTKQI